MFKSSAYTLRLLPLCIGMALLSSCETVVDIDLQQGTSELVVDALLTTESKAQEIRLTRTVGYLDNQTQSPAVTGAEVLITDNQQRVYRFVDEQKNGRYIWRPTTQQPNLGAVGTSHVLSVRHNNDVFTATSQVRRVPPIDSVFYEFRKENEEAFGAKEGYYVRFFASDLRGVGDCYRIKVFRNDSLRMRPQEIILAYDASFSKGGSTDGTLFILPIRNAVNRRDDPFQEGDRVRIEIHAVTEATFDFLQRVRTQLSNGGLFASPPANVGTNISNTNAQSRTTAVGWFGVSAISSVSVDIR